MKKNSENKKTMDNNVVIPEEQVQISKKKAKTYKGLIIGLSILGAAGLVSTITTSVILSKNRNTSIDPTIQEHKINFTQTPNWAINGPANAKKGDKVKFTVQSKVNTTTNVPSKLKIGALTKDLKEKNGIYQTDEFVWPFIEDVTVTLETVEQSIKTYTVFFNLNGGTLISSESTALRTVVEGARFGDINKPSYSAPAGYELDHWEDEAGHPINDDAIINKDTIVKAIWRVITGEIKHTLVFIADKDETVVSGDRELSIVNNTTWAQVKNLKETGNTFPVITKPGYKVGSYYIYNGTESKELQDTDIFTFTSSTKLYINISWTTAEYTVTFKNTEKTSFASGESETRTVKSGTKFEAVSRPVVVGKEDTTAKKKYVPNGKWYTDDSLTPDKEFNGDITEAITLYAGYITQDITESHTYTVNFHCAYGFKDGATTQWTQTTKVATEYKWSDVETKPDDKVKYPDGKSKDESAYTFTGWAMKDTDPIPEGTTNVYAQFEAKVKQYYTINFTSQEQIAWSGSQSFWFETTDTSKTKFGDLTYATPTKAGSTLIGWNVIAIKNGTQTTTGYKGTDWEATFQATKFSVIADPDTIITCTPIFEVDTTKHLVYIKSSDENKGTVSGETLRYVEINTPVSEIKKNISYEAKTGYESIQLRNAANGKILTDTDTIATDTIILYDFLQDIGGFQGKTWVETSNLCNNFEEGYIVEAEFVTNFLPFATSLADLLGLEGTVKINDQMHTVRVIDTQHDTITGSTKKAALTFELVTLLSNSDGYAMTSKWDTKYNYDYTNSILRKNLTGTDDSASWGDGSVTDERTAWQMLPSDLQNGIKSVTKSVSVYTGTYYQYGVKTYDDKLFPLTYTEMAQSGSSYANVEGTAYMYWTYHNTLQDRIKKGVNDNTSSYYWLVSPETNFGLYAWYVSDNGFIGNGSRYGDVDGTNGVSFGFCI